MTIPDVAVTECCMGNTPCRDHLGRSSGLVLGTFRKPGAAASAVPQPGYG